MKMTLSKSNRMGAGAVARRHARQANAVRVAVEPLETRLLMTTNSWKAAVSGDFDTASNWSLNHVPLSSEDVAITVAGANPYTVTMSSAHTVNSLTLGGASSTQTFTDNGGLSVSAASTIGAQGVYTANNVSLAGSGTLTNQGKLTLNGATVSEGLTNAGTLAIQGSDYINGSFVNNAGATIKLPASTYYANLTVASGFTNSGAIQLSDSPVNGNEYGATLTVSSGTLTNASTGSITSTGTGTSDILDAAVANAGSINPTTVPLTWNMNQYSSEISSNTGTISANANITLNMNGDGTFNNAGATNAAAGKTFTFSFGTLNENSGASLGGAGAIVWGNNTVNLNAALTNSATGLSISSATVNGPGKLTNAAGKTLTLYSTTIYAPFTNSGTLVAQGGNNILNGAFGNASGATVTIQSDNTSVYSASLTVANGFTNSGAIQLIDTSAAGTGNGNDYAATLTVNAGVITNAATGTITSSGAGNQNQLYAAVANAGTMTISSPLYWQMEQYSTEAASNSGTLNVNSTLTAYMSGDGTFTNTGAIAIASGQISTFEYGTFKESTGGSITGAGTFALSSATATLGAAFSNSATGFTATNSTINGPGTFTNAAGKTLTLYNDTINAPLTNNGTITIHGESNTFNGAFSNASGATLAFTQDTSYGGASLTLANGFTNSGAINLSDNLASGNDYGASLTVNAGVITNAAGATFTISGNGTDNTLYAGVANAGTMTVNAPLSWYANQYSGEASSNSGTINVNVSAPAYIASDGSFTNTGAIAIASGHTFTVNYGTFNENAGGSVTGAGTFALSSATAKFAANFSNAATAFTAYNSTLNGPGTLTNAAGKTLDLYNDTVNAPLTNNGTLTIHGSSNTLNGAFSNASGATLAFTQDTSYGGAYLTVANGFTNSGAINLSDNLAGGNDYGAQLTVQAGVITNAAGATFTISGNGTGNTLDAGVANAGTMTVNAPLSWYANQYSGEASSNSGTINVNASASPYIASDGSFTNTGAIAIASGQTFTVNYGTFNENAGGSVTGAGTFALSSATAKFAANFSNAATAFTAYNSTLNGPGTLTNAAGKTLDLYNDTVNAPLTNNGTLTIQSNDTLNGAFSNASGATLAFNQTPTYGGAELTIANGFTNSGAINLSDNLVSGSDYGATLTVNAGVITNAAGATFTVSGNGTEAGLYAAVTNAGTMSIQSPLYWQMTQYSNEVSSDSGTLNVTAPYSTLYMSSDGSFTSTGTMTIGAGANFTVQNGTFNANAGSISGGGSLAFQSGTATLAAGTFTAAGLSLSSATVTLGDTLSTAATIFSAVNSTINGPGITNSAGKTLTLSGDTVNAPLTNNGTLTIQSSDTLNGAFSNASGATLAFNQTPTYGGAELTIANGFTNSGAINLSDNLVSGSDYGATLTVNAGVITNAAGATFTVSGNGTEAGLYAAVTNAGTMSIQSPLYWQMSQYASEASANSGTLTVAAPLSLYLYGTSYDGTFTNTGAITIASGQNFIVQVGTFNSNAGSISGGGSLAFQNGTATLAAGTFTAAGLSLSSATVTLGDTLSTAATIFSAVNSTINGPGITNASGKTLTLISDTVNAPLTNNGTLTIHGGSNTFNGAFSNASGATLAFTQDTTYGGAELTIANGFTNNGAINLSDNLVSGSEYGASLTVSAGVLTNAAGATLTVSGNGTDANLYAAVTNAGTMSIQSPLYWQMTQYSNEASTNSATLTVAAPLTLYMNADGSFINAATLAINAGKTLTLSNNTLLTNAAGGVVSGAGTIAGNLTNSGTVVPDLGKLTVSGNYTQNSNGTLKINLGGTAAASYGKLGVGGTATLNGLLDIYLVNGFHPASGNTFTILSYGSRSGTFSSTDGTSLGGGLKLQFNPLSTSAALNTVAATADTTPPTVTSVVLGTSPAGGTTLQFVVTYNDNVALDDSSFGNGNVILSGPNGFSQAATFVSVTKVNNGTPRAVTYQVTAPAGTLDFTDNGTYTVTVNANSVKDTAGNALAAGTAGTFALSLPVPANSISGNAFFDANNNGSEDGAEQGLSGVNVYLDANNDGQFDGGDTAVSTDSLGNYAFLNLAAGGYVVREVPPAGDQVHSPAAGTLTGAYTLSLSAGGSFIGQNFATATDAAPTIATAAAANPSTVTGKTTALSVLGADDGGESKLTYTWTAPTLPAGATAPTFSVNGTNAAKATTATFSKAGTYGFTVTVADAAGHSVTSNVNVTVNQTLTAISVTPATGPTLALNAQQQFTASGTDQFGVVMTTQPAITWTASGGTITTAGLFKAGTTAGAYAVRAANSNGSIFGRVTGNVVNQAPTVATAAAANPSTVTGKTTALSVLGADDGGEANLKYTWAATTVPAGVTAPTFSANGTNASKATTATFSGAGNYVFTVTIADASNLTTTSTVSVTVNQTLTTITVSPAAGPTLALNQQQQFTASAVDQFGQPISTTITWTATGGTVSNTGLFTAGSTAGAYTVTATSGSVSGQSSGNIANQAPTVATAAAANPSTVTGTTTALSVLGADDGGEANLTYTWAATTVPAGVTAPTFSANGTNASKNTTATFSGAGSYVFTVTIADASNQTVTSTVSVTVNQTLTTITVSPATGPTLALNQQQQFTASAVDQFGQPISTTFTWTATGGTINSSGLFTAGSTAGAYTVTATSGSVSGQSSGTIANQAPTVATAAAANPSPVTAKTTSLSVLGADDGGEANLTYTWVATAVPAGAAAPTFSVNGTNAAKNSVATFSKAGAYTFQVTITDAASQSVTSSVNVTVNQTFTTVAVSPATGPNLPPGGKQQFTATALDQFGVAMTTQPAFTWTASGGTITSSGLFTAGSTIGAYAVRATSGSLSTRVTGNVANGPTVATPAAANPSTVTGTTTSLSVLGADAGGEANLTYTWAATTLPAGATAPTFSANGTNASKNTVATFSKAGTYVFTVTITNASAQSTTSTVSVTVKQTLTSVTVTPSVGPNVPRNGTQQFSASGFDQFGALMVTQPTFTWAASGGTINSSGLFTAQSTTGAYAVRATSGSLFARVTGQVV